MDIEQLRKVCLSLPQATEDIKWGNDLCFSIGGKMFCASSMEPPLVISFKVNEEDFQVLTDTNDVIPAPYLARHKWVQVQKAERFSGKEWEYYLQQSYELVKSRLSKKMLEKIQTSSKLLP